MSGEFIINPSDNHKKSTYHIKRILKEREELTIKSGVAGSFSATMICERLARWNYVTIENVSTLTSMDNGRRRISLNILLRKTKDFDKLMEENELQRKKYYEEKNQNKEVIG